MNEEKQKIVLNSWAGKSTPSARNTLFRGKANFLLLPSFLNHSLLGSGDHSWFECASSQPGLLRSFLAVLWAAEGTQQSSSQFSSQMVITVQGLGENELE